MEETLINTYMKSNNEIKEKEINELNNEQEIDELSKEKEMDEFFNNFKKDLKEENNTQNNSGNIKRIDIP
jgi:hypothetical protein